MGTVWNVLFIAYWSYSLPLLTATALSRQNVKVGDNRSHVHSPQLLTANDAGSPVLEDDPISKTFVVCNPSKVPNPCNEELLEVCRQLNGEYRCLCPENISRSSSGKCTVFNECFEPSTNNCSQDALCLDMEEGYSCECKEGLRDDSPDPSSPGRVCAVTDVSVSVSPVREKLAPAPSASSDLSRRRFLISGEKESNERASASSTREDGRSLLTNQEEAHHAGDAQHSEVIASLKAFHAASSGEDQKSSTSASNAGGIDQSQSEFNDDSLREVFKSIDLDRNEMVDFGELRSTANFYSLRISDKQIRLMVKVADRNGDGNVDLEEFVAVMSH